MARWVVAAIIAYTLLIGANVIGVMRPDVNRISLPIFAAALAAWLLWRRVRWHWYSTPLDSAIPFWGTAFALSLALNPDVWRQSATALWYVGLYVVVWYVLYDSLANSAITSRQVVSALLFVGLVNIFLGYVQYALMLSTDWAAILAGTKDITLLRPAGLLGNPNLLASFLIALLPLAVGRFFSGQARVDRTANGLYVVASSGLLFLTLSRGAWIGASVGLLLQGYLMLRARRMLSPGAWRSWWGRRSTTQRFWTGVAGGLGAMIVLVAVVVFVAMFSIGGRTVDWRTIIWEPALRMFGERPLAGHGLLTFGTHLARFISWPPGQVQTHAHSVPLHVAAELGLAGLLALVISIARVLIAFARVWNRASDSRRLTLSAVLGAVVAIGAHNVFDMTIMNPALALTATALLAIVTVPSMPVAPTSRRGAVWPMLVAALAVILIATGAWRNQLDQRYLDILAYGAYSQEYAHAAAELQPLIDVDPANAVNYAEQGLLYGAAAAHGDLDAARAGIVAFESFVRLQPNFASAWANLAALYWQTGASDLALAAMRRAVHLAPMAPALAYRLGSWLEATGNAVDAALTYERALRLEPALARTPLWGVTEVQRSITLPPMTVRESTLALVDVNEDGRFADVPTLLRNDYVSGTSFLVHGYMRQALPRQFLPQVGYFALVSRLELDL